MEPLEQETRGGTLSLNQRSFVVLLGRVPPSAD